MQIKLNNITITSQHMMFVVSLISIATTIILSYMKFFTTNNIDSNSILFSLIISISSVYLTINRK